MSGDPHPTQDDYARNKGLAAISIVTNLLRVLVDKQVLTKSEVRDLLNEAVRPFIHPHATDIQSMAAATIVTVLQDTAPPSP